MKGVLRALLAAGSLTAFLAPAYAVPLELAIGDSIAVGLRLPGSAQVGIGPKAVFERIAMISPNDLYGTVVVLSTGLSNDPSGINYVPVMLAMLHAAGAHVIVLGVGVELKGSLELNMYLKAYAIHFGMPYIDGWQHVHPDNYRKLLENVRWFECVTYQICAA